VKAKRAYVWADEHGLGLAGSVWWLEARLYGREHARVGWIDVKGAPAARLEMVVESIPEEDANVAIYCVASSVALASRDMLLPRSFCDGDHHVPLACEDLVGVCVHIRELHMHLCRVRRAACSGNERCASKVQTADVSAGASLGDRFDQVWW
jgi:hypothetical protein